MKQQIAKVLTPVQQFMKTEAASGVVLGIAALLALIIANSPARHAYDEVLHTSFRIGLGSFELDNSIAHWINDGLMAVFFLLVGLEIKREIKYGELSDVRSASLPIAAAVGGAVVPAAIFFAFCVNTEYQAGWAIPMATDIAFAMGTLALLGPRIPSWAKIFLMASAVVDDLLAVLVIAVFYTTDLKIEALMWGALFLGVLIMMNFFGVKAIAPYLLVGLALWIAFLESGVHATIAGVLLGFTIPASRIAKERLRPLSDRIMHLLQADDVVTREERERLQSCLNEVEDRVVDAESPLHRLEHSLHPVVAFGIMPIFAFASAGVAIDTSALGAVLTSKLTLGIVLGLFVGKQIGIVGAWLVLAKLGLSKVELSSNTFRYVHGLSLLAGIGFTMSLFVGGLAFGEGAIFEEAKLAILGASLISGVAGYLLLRSVTVRTGTSGA